MVRGRWLVEGAGSADRSIEIYRLMGRRGLFRQDLGDHPPEIREFLESYWHRPRRGGEFHRISIGAPSSAEVRENARWFGSLLVLTAVIMPVAYWKWAGDRVTVFGYAVLFLFSASFAAFGVVLLRSSRVAGPGTSKREPKARRESDQGREQDLP